MSGDEAAVLKALADDAAEALGRAGGSLAEFAEKTARTADETANRVLSTETRNVEVFEKIHEKHVPAALVPLAAGDTVLRHRISGLLDAREAGASSGTGSGAGAWNGENDLYLTEKENAAAEKFLERARDAAARITPVVMDVKDGVPGAEAAGFPGHVLKASESFKRKLATTLFESPARDLDAALADMKDSVRYTLKFPDSGYTDGVNQAIAKFREAGFESVKFKNTWGSAAYQGINSFWRDPQAGHVFEMQFHTRESFAAKTETHALYEQARLPGVDPERARALDERQNQILGSVPRPPGASGIEPPETGK